MAEIEIKRYPMNMTGAKLRRKLGIEPKYPKESFKLRQKFRCVPKAERLTYLLNKMKGGRDISFKEQWDKRKWFDRTKNRVFPMAKDCHCYVCDGIARIRHHVRPISKGGRNKKNNIVPLCHDCHCLLHPKMRKHK